MRRFEEALHEYELVQEDFSDSDRLKFWYVIGSGLERDGRLEEALGAYEELKNIHPCNVLFCINCLYKMGEYARVFEYAGAFFKAGKILKNSEYFYQEIEPFLANGLYRITCSKLKISNAHEDIDYDGSIKLIENWNPGTSQPIELRLFSALKAGRCRCGGGACSRAARL